MKAYKIFTGEDPDKDPSPTDNKEFDFEDIGEKPIGKDKLDAIQSLELDPEKAKEILKEFGYNKSSGIKVKDFAKIFEVLKSNAKKS